MQLNEAFLLGPHGIQVVLLQAKQQGLRHLDEAVLVDENLLSCEALVADSAGIERLQSSAAAVEDAPEVTLLEGVELVILGPLLDLLGSILEGVLEHQVHLVLDGADVVLLLLLDLDEREQVVVLDVCPAFEEGLEPLEVGLAGAGDHPHEVVLGVSLTPQKRVAVVLYFEDLEFFLDLLL